MHNHRRTTYPTASAEDRKTLGRFEKGAITIETIVAVLLLCVAFIAFGTAAVIVRGSVPPNASGVAISDAPVFSARRLPEVIRSGVARQRLGVAIDTTLTDPALANALNASCVVIEISGGIVVSRTPERQVLPASTMKTLTAAAVLARIDPNDTFVTEVRATTAPSNGVLNGDLWLLGGGDPLLETTEYTQTQQHDKDSATSFDNLVQRVIDAGVTQVTGGIIGDARRYDDERVRKTWKKNYVSDGEVGPIGGLMVDDNFTLINAKEKRVAATNAPADAAQLLRTKLEAAGVTVGNPSIGADAAMPEASTAAPVLLASVTSIPVGAVVREMLSWSDNTTAEMFIKELGFRASGIGSWTEGLAAVKSSLAAQGVALDGLNMIDGSGLDRANRVTCAVLLSTVRSQRVDGPFFKGLSVMGEYGTLRKRLRGSPAQGIVHAKTGSLNGVSSLTGFALTAERSDAHFAMVFNELASTGDGVRAGNAIAESIVAFPSAPSTAEFSLPGQIPTPKPVLTRPPEAATPVSVAESVLGDSTGSTASNARPDKNGIPSVSQQTDPSLAPNSTTAANSPTAANSSTTAGTVTNTAVTNTAVTNTAVTNTAVTNTAVTKPGIRNSAAPENSTAETSGLGQ